MFLQSVRGHEHTMGEYRIRGCFSFYCNGHTWANWASNDLPKLLWYQVQWKSCINIPVPWSLQNSETTYKSFHNGVSFRKLPAFAPLSSHLLGCPWAKEPDRSRVVSEYGHHVKIQPSANPTIHNMFYEFLSLSFWCSNMFKLFLLILPNSFFSRCCNPFWSYFCFILAFLLILLHSSM